MTILKRLHQIEKNYVQVVEDIFILNLGGGIIFCIISEIKFYIIIITLDIEIINLSIPPPELKKY